MAIHKDRSREVAPFVAKIRLAIGLGALLSLSFMVSNAAAGTYRLGAIKMYICDGGLDLCSNTLISPVIDLPGGAFSEDFVFDVVNGLPQTGEPAIEDNIARLRATAAFSTPNSSDLGSGDMKVFNPESLRIDDDPAASHTFVESPPDGLVGAVHALVPSGDGYDFRVSGSSGIDRLPLQVTLDAFDLGPLDTPEPSTWAMLCVGFAALCAAAHFRARDRRSADRGWRADVSAGEVRAPESA